MKKQKFDGLSIRLTKTESNKIKTMKDKHCINISALIRQSINELFDKLENKK